MSVNEYAALEYRLGANLVEVDRLWWRRTRFGFFRPLLPFTAFQPGTRTIPPFARFGGYQHLVPHEGEANSAIRYLVFDDLKGYTLENLEAHYRKNTRKGLSNFEVRLIHDRDEFLSQGFRIYQSFYHRTRYGFRKDRLQTGGFESWAGVLFDNPKVWLLGAYGEGGLCGITVAYLVEDMIVSPTYFAETAALRLRVSEAMLHTLRSLAAECGVARWLFMGVAGSSATRDEFKESRGCRLITLPAFCRINPFIEPFIRRFRPRDYERLGWRSCHASVPCASVSSALRTADR
jgi:hypothetical protein